MGIELGITLTGEAAAEFERKIEVVDRHSVDWSKQMESAKKIMEKSELSKSK